MGKNNSEFASIWHLVSDEQKIAYLDAAASNTLSWDVAFIALNDPSEDVRVSALVAFVECCNEVYHVVKDWLIHPNWYVREAAIRVCERLQLPPAEWMVVRTFAKYPENVSRLCEIQDSWSQVIGYCFANFSEDVWRICGGDYANYFIARIDKSISKCVVAKMACARSEKIISHYRAYCGIYQQWAELHPDAATQSVEERAACLIFADWLERYADPGHTIA